MNKVIAIRKGRQSLAGMAMISLLLVLLIISFMGYFAWTTTKKKPDDSTKSFTEGAGLDTSSYKGILDSTKKVLDNAVATREQNPF